MGPSLRQRLEGVSNDTARAELILNLPKRSVLAPSNHECLLDILRSEANPLIQFAIARTLARADGARVAEHVVPVFLRLLADVKPLVQAYKPIATRGYDAADEIAICLCLVGKDQAPTILPVLDDVLDRYTGFNATMLAHALLWLALSGRPKPEGLSFQQMTSEQQQALKWIAASTRAWRFVNIAESLTFFGLPTTREALRQFCNQ